MPVTGRVLEGRIRAASGIVATTAVQDVRVMADSGAPVLQALVSARAAGKEEGGAACWSGTRAIDV